MTTLSVSDLDQVIGGISRSTQAHEVCNRTQFDWMAAHMVPDGTMKPGVQRHVIAADAKLCGFPMPGK
jgi:hypothetical protein